MVRQRIGRVSHFMRNANLPKELRRRVLRHLQHVLLEKRLSLDASDLLRDLSQPLREEIALHRCEQLVLTMFGERGVFAALSSSIDPPFIKALVTRLELAVFSPGDYVIEYGEVADRVFFIGAGEIATILANGTELSRRAAGDCVGEIALLSGGRRTAHCVALTFTECFTLSSFNFRDVLRDFPEIEASMRRVARERALQLEIVEQKTNQGHASARRSAAERSVGARSSGAPPPPTYEITTEKCSRRVAGLSSGERQRGAGRECGIEGRGRVLNRQSKSICDRRLARRSSSWLLTWPAWLLTCAVTRAVAVPRAAFAAGAARCAARKKWRAMRRKRRPCSTSS